VLLPIATFAVLLVAWQFLVRLFGVPEYILPLPTEFLSKLVESRALIWQHTLVTASEVLLGFLFAAAIGVPLGLMIVSFKWLERSLYPLIVFFQLIPKIAVAPLFVVWFGFGPFPKVLLTFLLCFFPTLVASMTGFRALDERVLYLTRSMGANAGQTFRYIRLPSAIAHIFGGFKVSIVFAATGAIVAEFVGSNSGLGYLLLRATSYLDMPLIFAVLVALSAIGIVFSYAVQLLERLCMPWLRGD
jgi:NitT/TauT family transport system permease protein